MFSGTSDSVVAIMALTGFMVMELRGVEVLVLQRRNEFYQSALLRHNLAAPPTNMIQP
jgi:hypothetical protein